MTQYLNLDPSRQRLNIVSGQRTANSIIEAAIDCGIATVINERFVLHVHEIDTPTLSRKFRQPFHQSFKDNINTGGTRTYQGLVRYRATSPGTCRITTFILATGSSRTGMRGPVKLW